MTRPPLRLAIAAALMLLAQALPQIAHAQYSWIDEKGTRVFSDQPPPPGTPASRILKAPRRADADAGPATTSTAAAAPDAAKPSTLADREADYRKRQAEQKEADKKAQDEAVRKAQQREACADARQQEAQLASGVRISEMAANGERSYMSDEERARRLARARQALAECR